MLVVYLVFIIVLSLQVLLKMIKAWPSGEELFAVGDRVRCSIDLHQTLEGNLARYTSRLFKQLLDVTQ